jgi:hypothetical protein
MPKRKLLAKLLILLALGSVLVLAIPPAGIKSRAAFICDEDVYEFCWSQGRVVNPETCECNYQSCLGVPASDCTEQGQTLNYDTCMCEGGELTPWCGMNSYSTCFNQGLALNPITCNCYTSDTGGDMPLCTFGSYVWCGSNGGEWQGWNCKCGFKDTNNNCTATAAVRLSCENSGGTWNVSQCLCDY